MSVMFFSPKFLCVMLNVFECHLFSTGYGVSGVCILLFEKHASTLIMSFFNVEIDRNVYDRCVV